ncbi:hypothetical protein [Terrilactibacillus laevilacticus]|uniref:Uncharacterized protein n=1 Tax=Terrilactibacillus laevilacticus TaxID=1380157 RepID=A0ABW5PM68_9BACI|nr:hypothetical protein [Terrilactibacillus laevilacticus]
MKMFFALVVEGKPENMGYMKKRFTLNINPIGSPSCGEDAQIAIKHFH